ncbi:hypothetical protein F2Q69_00028352 [Brassica cretica]|uniref:Ubiquitin-like protease family profile domain-containing protein n=1 Tax=Brassica cretica TaxID=69181 RepID=A0A8S9RUR5_BRACR|nr:hypothetical protein F2Q69_00028352 [Brassica cretica]
MHSISYHTCWTLHTALKKALHDDEYEELNESKLGVSSSSKSWDLIGLQEFENLTGLNYEYIEDLERPHCVVTKELTSFWEMLGCASSDEQRAQYSIEPFTYERLTNIPQARAGDCGMYALKYSECHALVMPFSKKDFAKPNGKTMRDKMAVDIFKELPDAHEFENKDNDANLGAYEG